MSPTVDEGERVFVVIPPDRVEVGDVVVYETEDTRLMHRIVASIPLTPWYVQKGDNPVHPASLIHRSQIVGRVVTVPAVHVPWLRRLIYVIQGMRWVGIRRMKSLLSQTS